MQFFSERNIDANLENSFKSRLSHPDVSSKLDGMHMITLLFQCSRARRRIKQLLPPALVLEKLNKWENEWSERDISTFVYGLRSLECVR